MTSSTKPPERSRALVVFGGGADLLGEEGLAEVEILAGQHCLSCGEGALVDNDWAEQVGRDVSGVVADGEDDQQNNVVNRFDTATGNGGVVNLGA